MPWAVCVATWNSKLINRPVCADGTVALGIVAWFTFDLGSWTKCLILFKYLIRWLLSSDNHILEESSDYIFIYH